MTGIAARRLRRFGATVGVALILLVGAATWVVGTHSGTQFAVSRFLAFYNDWVPGAIRIDRVSGSLLGGLTLEGVHLNDREEKPIIDAKRLELDLMPRALMDGVLHASNIRVEGVRLFIRFYGDESAFVDLGPKSDETVETPEEPFDELVLPLSLAVDHLRILDTHLFFVDPNGAKEFVSADEVMLFGRWDRGNARFRIQEVKARLQGDALALTHFSGTAVMEGGKHTRLENARAETNRGSIAFEDTGFDIDTANGRFHLRFETQAARFSDWVELPEALESADGRLDLTLTRGEDLKGEVSVFVGAATVTAAAESQFSKLPNTKGRFSIRRVVPEDLGIPLAAIFGGDGNFDFSMEPHVGPRLAASFEGRDCNLRKVGPLSISADGTLVGKTSNAALHLLAMNVEFVAEGSVLSDGKSNFSWKANAANIRSLESLASIKRTNGSLVGEGQCTVEERVLSCAYDLRGKRLRLPDVSIASLKSKGDFLLSADRLSIGGRTSLTKVRLPGIGFRTVELETRKRAQGFSITLNAEESSGRHAAAEGHVFRENEKIQIALNRLESNLFGLNFRLAAPALISILENGAALNPRGVQLETAGGRVSLYGALEKKQLKKIRVTLADIRLDAPARLLHLGRMDGTLDLNLNADGPLSNPSFNAAGTVSNFEALGMAPKTVRLDVALSDRNFGFHVSVEDNGALRLLAAGQGGVLLRLTSFKAELLESRPVELDFEMRGISEKDASLLVKLPDALTFSADANGHLIYSSPADLSLKGRLSGAVSYPQVGTLRPSVTFEVLPETQRAALEVRHEKLPPLHMDAKTAVSLPKLFDGVLKVARSEADFTLGKASLSVQLDTLEGDSLRVRTQFAGVDTETASIYFKDFPVKGTVSGGAILERFGKNLSLKADVTARDFLIREVALGNWNAALDWQGEAAEVEARLLQKGRTVAALSARVPLTPSLDTRDLIWHPEQVHQISWQIENPDLAAMAPIFNFKQFRIVNLFGQGRFSGTTKHVSGKASLSAVFEHEKLGEVPLEVFLSTEKGIQKLVVDVLKGRKAAASLVAESHLNLEALRLGKVKLSHLPLNAELKMPQFDLANLNVLDLSPVYDITGTASCAVRLTGTWAVPHLTGQVLVNRGALSLADLEDPIRDIRLDLRFNDRQVKLKELSAKSRQGSAAAAANGLFSKKGDLSLRALIKARGFRIAYAGLPVFLLTTDTSLNFGMKPSTVHLDLTLSNSVIEHIIADKLNVKKVHVNVNTKVIEATSKKEETSATEIPGRDFRLTVRTSSPLKIQGAALDTRWKMDMSALFQKEGVRIDGNAVLTKGSFDLFANTFVVEDAGAFFTEQSGLDPHIQLSSSTTLPDAKVYLRVEGTVGSPRLQLFSEPALPQEAILSMLISGSAEENVSGSSVIANVIQMRYPVVANILQNKLGFDRVAIGSAPSGNGTVVKLGKRINDKLFFYTSFNLNADEDENDYDVNFEYDIVDRVTLDTMAGNEVSSVEIGWRVPLGKRSRRAEKAKNKK